VTPFTAMSNDAGSFPGDLVIAMTAAFAELNADAFGCLPAAGDDRHAAVETDVVDLQGSASSYCLNVLTLTALARM
jgi:hypothetical protein